MNIFHLKNKIWNRIKSKYYKIKEVINNFRKLPIIEILKEFIIFKLRLSASYYLKTGLLKSDGKQYELVYYNGDVKYKIRFSKNRGVRQICHIETHVRVNVTSEILELMGPGLNFYGIPSTPSLLGWNEGLFIKYRNGQEIFYNTNEVIKLKVDN
jgi:hypothetical protein